MSITGNVFRGSVIELNLNPAIGHEQAMIRPVIVISDGIIQSNPSSTNAFIVPITNRDKHNVFKISIPPGISVDGSLVGKPNWTTLGGFAIPNHARSVDLDARNAVVVGQIDPSSDFYQRVVTIVRAIIA